LAENGKLRALSNVGIRVQVVGFDHIGGLIGIRKHHHRDSAEQGVLLDMFQNFKAILSGHMKVEEQEISGFFQGIEGLVAVMDSLEFVGDSGSF